MKITWRIDRRRMSRESHRPLRLAIPRDRALEFARSAASLSRACFRRPLVSLSRVLWCGLR